MSSFKRIAGIVLLAGILLAAIAIFRAWRLPSRQVAVPTGAIAFTPLPGAVERFAGAIRFPTVVTDDPSERQPEVFAALTRYLAGAFPVTHRALGREGIGRDALLYTWPGSDRTLKPVVLMGHLDVVPVDPGSEKLWLHRPFAGEIADGSLWGRGALDDKATVLAILEAAESLIGGGFRPRRTILFAFGADEERGGPEGAPVIAETVRSRYGSVEFVVDEGGAIVAPGLIPGMAAPVAVVGIAEKGFVNIELSADDQGGASTTPPTHTTVGKVARAVARVEDRPFPASFHGVTAQLFDYLAPEMPFGPRMLFANRWLFAPLITRLLGRAPETDATIRTTTAATMFQGSPKDNVLAGHARAVINFRILPGDSVDGVIDHVRRAIDDPTIHVRTVDMAVPPSPVSSTDASNWHLIERTVRQTFPDVLVAPYLTLGATDARYYRALTPDIYRLLPVRLPPGGPRLLHGTNERISIAAYLDAIRFYETLIENSTR